MGNCGKNGSYFSKIGGKKPFSKNIIFSLFDLEIRISLFYFYQLIQCGNDWMNNKWMSSKRWYLLNCLSNWCNLICYHSSWRKQFQTDQTIIKNQFQSFVFWLKQLHWNEVTKKTNQLIWMCFLIVFFFVCFWGVENGLDDVLQSYDCINEMMKQHHKQQLFNQSQYLIWKKWKWESSLQ